MSGKRTLLLLVAGFLCVAALVAIGILLFGGHFGRTEARIVGSIAVLGLFALLAFPAAVLADQHRAPRLAGLDAATAAAGATAALVAIWWSTDTAGKTAASAAAVAVAAAQCAALFARRRATDPRVVPALYAVSVGAIAVVATMIVVLSWAQFDSPGYGRVLGAVVVLDALVVALQPLLARALTPR